MWWPGRPGGRGRPEAPGGWPRPVRRHGQPSVPKTSSSFLIMSSGVAMKVLSQRMSRSMVTVTPVASVWSRV